MSYLQEYLKVIPQVESEIIESYLKKNEEIFSILDISEKEFKALIDKVNEDYKTLTYPIKLSQKIKSEDFNEFYKNVAVDLVRLFANQNQIEGAAENYNRIYEGNLEDIRKEIDNLENKVKELDMEAQAEEGLRIHSFNFEPAAIYANVEKDYDKFKYMFQDRDGSVLKPVDIKRTYHKYHASLSTQSANNLLTDDNGKTNADIKVLYQSIYSIDLENNKYDIQNILNNNTGAYWIDVSLKPNNNSDSVSINP